MKYCTHCGTQLDDAAVFCACCGAAVENADSSENKRSDSETDDTINVIAEVFMVLGCVAIGWCIIPLIWCIPMTVSLFRKVKSGRRIGVGFKVCTLLFVSLVAGIVLLCRDERKYAD